ncbi:class B sortase [Clostridium sp. AL.422]|uniref:class B sortase n=1 Tax=Clostridium TaxID=1485 RepID=UPI00293DD009|nr:MULTISPECIES: class B sortase [unclassified Clostridium]MDV4150139.1 class B sortase [Clostridium sp. AL.422]
MRELLRKTLILIFLGIFIFSTYNLYKIFSEYKGNKEVYNDISEIVVKEDKEVKIKNDEYAALKEINEDYIFWINIPETNINYPVVRSENNEEYLYKNFKGEANSGGSIFLDSRNESLEDENIIVHGHNMKDKSMFGTLSKLLSSDYLSNNKKIYIHLENKILEYEIFSVYVNNGDFNPYKTNFSTDEDFNEYINSVRRKSYQTLDYLEEGNKNILTLSTCTNATGEERTLVHAKLKAEKEI